MTEEDYVEESKQVDHEIADLIVQVYDKMVKESKPLDPELQKILNDNIMDLF